MNVLALRQILPTWRNHFRPGSSSRPNPIKASKPSSGPDWVHEIKHDGYRMMVRRDGPAVRLYRRNAYDWTVRLPTIATAAERIKAKRLHDRRRGRPVGPDGSSRFDELRRRTASRTAILYAFDLIEHDGKDLPNHPFLDRKAALARLLRDTTTGILLNEHVAEGGPTFFAHARRLGAEGIVSQKVNGAYDQVRAQSGSRFAWNR